MVFKKKYFNSHENFAWSFAPEGPAHACVTEHAQYLFYRCLTNTGDCVFISLPNPVILLLTLTLPVCITHT